MKVPVSWLKKYINLGGLGILNISFFNQYDIPHLKINLNILEY